jgi:hypothetical protein
MVSMDSQTIIQELEKEAKRYEDTYLDVDKERHFLEERARKWAEYNVQENFDEGEWETLVLMLWPQGEEKSRQGLLETFAIDIRTSLLLKERHLIRTTKPYTHQALFIEVAIEYYIKKAQELGYLDNTQFTEKAVRLIKMEHFFNPDILPIPSVRFPDFTAIRAIADKDKELFPDPEPLRVEVAGTVISFTSWEAALVVYLDCEYKGKRLFLNTNDNNINNELVKTKRNHANIVEKTEGNNSICVAVFPRIPLVTNWHRHFSEVLTHVDCTVEYFESYVEDNKVRYKGYKEVVTLFRGNVIDLDWRGRSLEDDI